MLNNSRKLLRKLIKFQKKMHYKLSILFFAGCVFFSLSFPQHSLANNSVENDSDIKLQGIIIEDALFSILNLNINRLPLKQNCLPEIKDRELKIFNYRYITAYNVGVVAQTDNTPCIGASGDNLCELIELGVNICAANFVPLRTDLEIEGIGKCKVLDRMNKRYSFRVDIAMGPDEIAKAEQFGIKFKKVGVY